MKSLSAVHLALWVSLFGVISVGLTACSTAPKIEQNLPGWVSDPGQDYPSDRYWVAVGSGGSLEQAEFAAKRNLAQGFRSQVVSERTTQNQSSVNQSSGGGVDAASTESYGQKTTLFTDIMVRGAETKTSSKVGDTFYVRVVSDKLWARSSLLAELQAAERKLDAACDQAENLKRKDFIETAKELLARLQVLEQEGAILGVASVKSSSTYGARIVALERLLAGSLQGKKIKLTEKTSGMLAVQSGVESCLTENGATLAGTTSGDGLEGSEGAVIGVELSVRERPQPLKVEGFKRVRFDVSIGIQGLQSRSGGLVTETVDARDHAQASEIVSDRLTQKTCEKIIDLLNR